MAHHHTAAMVSVSSVSSLGCVGDGRCASAVCTLASLTVVPLEYRGIVNIDDFPSHSIRMDTVLFLFCECWHASCSYR